MVLTTAPDLKTATNLAKTLVKKKTAACVSFREGFTSFYRWKGKIERSQETLLFIKTTRKKFPELKNLITKLHPYSVPEILAIPVSGGSAKYLSWIEESVR